MNRLGAREKELRDLSWLIKFDLPSRHASGDLKQSMESLRPK